MRETHGRPCGRTEAASGARSSTAHCRRCQRARFGSASRTCTCSGSPRTGGRAPRWRLRRCRTWGASAQLINDGEGGCGGEPQDGVSLLKFHQERAFALQDAVAGADARQQAVNQRQCTLRRGHGASHNQYYRWRSSSHCSFFFTSQ